MAVDEVALLDLSKNNTSSVTACAAPASPQGEAYSAAGRVIAQEGISQAIGKAGGFDFSRRNPPLPYRRAVISVVY